MAETLTGKLMPSDTPAGPGSATDTHQPPAGFGVRRSAEPLGSIGLRPPRDRFGFPLDDFDQATESQQQTAARHRAVLKGMEKVRNLAAQHLGETEAQSAWHALSKRRTGGRPKGFHNPSADALLLTLYDVRAEGLSGEERGRVPQMVAEQVKRQLPRWFSATVGSIASRLRWLRRHLGLTDV
jgi:hypothetical protein